LHLLRFHVVTKGNRMQSGTSPSSCSVAGARVNGDPPIPSKVATDAGRPAVATSHDVNHDVTADRLDIALERLGAAGRLTDAEADMAIDVLRVRDGVVTEIVTFDRAVFKNFDLPATLGATVGTR